MRVYRQHDVRDCNIGTDSDAAAHLKRVRSARKREREKDNEAEAQNNEQAEHKLCI